MSNGNKLRIIGAVVFMLLLMTSCRPRESSRNKVEAMLKELPVPDTAMPVAREDGWDVGSERGCAWAYTKLLYGTNESPEQVIAFYKPWMMARGSYEEREHRISFIDAEGFALSVEVNVPVAAGMHNTVITEPVISEARSKFPTVYLIEIAYAPPSTWEHCSVVELPTPQPQ